MHAALVYSRTSLILGHPCYSQLSSVKARYLLTWVSLDDIAGSSVKLIEFTFI